MQRYIQLYNRVKTYGKLPRPGGLDNQFERDLQALDAIESAVNEPMGPTAHDVATYESLPPALQEQVRRAREQRRG